jgi:hypothetical protein
MPMNFQLSNRELIIPKVDHPNYLDRKYLWGARFGHELYSVKELKELDLYPFESHRLGPEVRSVRQENHDRWTAFEDNQDQGPRSALGKGCRRYFPRSVFEHEHSDNRKADTAKGMSYRQLNLGGGYKRYGSEMINVSDLTVLLPRTPPIDCVPTRFRKDAVRNLGNHSGGNIDGPTICDNKLAVGTTRIWISRLIKLVDLEASGWLDRVRPGPDGRYELPDLEYEVAVHCDKDGRMIVKF